MHITLKETADNVKASLVPFFQTHLVFKHAENNTLRLSETRKRPWDAAAAGINGPAVQNPSLMTAARNDGVPECTRGTGTLCLQRSFAAAICCSSKRKTHEKAQNTLTE